MTAADIVRAQLRASLAALEPSVSLVELAALAERLGEEADLAGEEAAAAEAARKFGAAWKALGRANGLRAAAGAVIALAMSAISPEPKLGDPGGFR
jgi:hypothetical protein